MSHRSMVFFTCSKLCFCKYVNKRKSSFVQLFEKLASSPLKRFPLALFNQILVKTENSIPALLGVGSVCAGVYGKGIHPL